jgi:hypothetical protein
MTSTRVPHHTATCRSCRNSPPSRLSRRSAAGSARSPTRPRTHRPVSRSSSRARTPRLRLTRRLEQPGQRPGTLIRSAPPLQVPQPGPLAVLVRQGRERHQLAIGAPRSVTTTSHPASPGRDSGQVAFSSRPADFFI